MRYEWPGKDLDLGTLVKHIEEFLKARNFIAETPTPGDSTKTEVLAIPTGTTEIRNVVRIEASKTTDGVAINFASTGRAEESIKLGMIYQFALGGAILAKSVSTKEKLDALETEFWAYIQEFIADHANRHDPR
ncbi:hypothetical protein MUO69_06250 [Candidatus Bathyarchaeota archaeon]|jgi:hypothetical protein|nr:hypothetical protein [Candidatus Bathyarchaeota archaeon]